MSRYYYSAPHDLETSIPIITNNAFITLLDDVSARVAPDRTIANADDRYPSHSSLASVSPAGDRGLVHPLLMSSKVAMCQSVQLARLSERRMVTVLKQDIRVSGSYKQMN